MANFKRAHKRTGRYEGGFFHSRFDSGGATRWGVTQARARKNGYIGDMRQFPLGFALNIYKKDYWTPLNLDSIDQRIANEVYDIHVNGGVGGRVLQRALNIVNVVLLSRDRLLKLYPKLKVDGKVGSTTLKAYEVLRQRHELLLLYKWVEFYVAKHYEACALNPKQKRRGGILTQKGFVRSWTRRVFDDIRLIFLKKVG